LIVERRDVAQGVAPGSGGCTRVIRAGDDLPGAQTGSVSSPVQGALPFRQPEAERDRAAAGTPRIRVSDRTADAAASLRRSDMDAGFHDIEAAHCCERPAVSRVQAREGRIGGIHTLGAGRPFAQPHRTSLYYVVASRAMVRSARAGPWCLERSCSSRPPSALPRPSPTARAPRHVRPGRKRPRLGLTVRRRARRSGPGARREPAPRPPRRDGRRRGVVTPRRGMAQTGGPVSSSASCIRAVSGRW
jgi:hypothetical protein